VGVMHGRNLRETPERIANSPDGDVHTGITPECELIFMGVPCGYLASWTAMIHLHGDKYGIRPRRSPDPRRDEFVRLAAAVVIVVTFSVGAVLVVAGMTVMSWVMARTGEVVGVSVRPVLAGVALAVLIGMLWGIYRIVRQVYQFTAGALFRILSPNEPSTTNA
jgi:hypothetical protein